MLAGVLGEVIGLCLFAFVGGYLGIFKRREAKLYGLDLLWMYLLTVAASFAPYLLMQTAVAFAAVAIYGRLPDGAYTVSTGLGLVICTYIARRLIEWREAAQSNKKGTVA